MRHAGTHEQNPTSVSLRQPTSVPGRKLHLERKARAPQLGCSQNPGALAAPVLRYSHPGEKYHPRGAGSLRPGGAPRSGAPSRPRDAALLSQRPNELWCTDYKGEFLLGNHQYCYPLTVTDHASRFLLTCEALSSTREEYAFTVFERLFKERGLPANIRSDNGVPFASAHALFNLSKLAVWWLRLGIGIERIKPGHPQQ